jgi:hypothetical protein
MIELEYGKKFAIQFQGPQDFSIRTLYLACLGRALVFDLMGLRQREGGIDHVQQELEKGTVCLFVETRKCVLFARRR